jgi:hypothetical protein
MRRLPFSLVALLALAAPAILANTITINFEGLPDSTILTNQYSGVTFTNAIILSAGISLNEFEFPPHSGVNVASDNGGPMSIVFTSPIASFSGYFTYAESLTVQAFGSDSNQVALAASLFSNNEAMSGVPGSSPNEFLRVGSSGGISRIAITGDPAGGSFALDDVAYSTSAASVPEPGTLLVAGLGLLCLILLGHRRFLSKKSSIPIFLILIAIARHPLAAAPTLGASDISQTTLVANTPTLLTITVAIDDPSVIPSSVNLLRLNPGGQPTILGQLHDDGKNGDLVARDKIYTIQTTFSETALGQFQLQISAAFKGVLTRTLLTLPRVFVQPPSAPQQALTGLMTELQAGNISAALKRFAPSPSTTNVLTNLTTTGKATLVLALATATLVKSTGDLRVYKAQWLEQDGTTSFVELFMAPDASGQWIIVSW